MTLTTIFTGISEVDRLLERAEEKRKDDLGQSIRQTLLVAADRYLFDFGLDRDEWEEFDTENDASYFGIWLNKSKLQTLHYVEGDVSFTQCDSPESFDSEVAALCSFYKAAPAFTSFDENWTATQYYQDRSEFFIDPDRAAAALRASRDASQDDSEGGE